MKQHQPATSKKRRTSNMNRSLCVLAITLVACVAGSVPSSFADENEELYESPTAEVEMRMTPEKRTSRGLDPMAGITFGSIKKRIDSLSGDSFGAQKRSEESKLRGFIRKNLAAEHELMSGLNRHLADRDQQNDFLVSKKSPLPYPYYLSYAPVYYRVKDRGM